MDRGDWDINNGARGLLELRIMFVKALKIPQNWDLGIDLTLGQIFPKGDCAGFGRAIGEGGGRALRKRIDLKCCDRSGGVGLVPHNKRLPLFLSNPWI
jgi:hypothetical protein